jgi:aminoglycoside phosphotransferase (APT) family kinase protein
MEVTRKNLTSWLTGKLTPAGELTLSEIGGPAFSGFSNETLIFDAHWTDPSGGARDEGYVIRVQPTDHTVFLEAEFDTQYRVMQLMSEKTDIPVPPVLWFEEDPAALGAPFFAMGRVAGEVPCDNPPYTMGGWPHDAASEDQSRLWWDGLEVMARIHNLDWRALGFGFVDKPARGTTGLDQQLTYYKEYLAWAAQGTPFPLVESGLAWLEANRPPPPARGDALCWGDARIGNMIFDDFTCRAVLDWEMVTPGDPVQDLAWFVFLDRHHSEGLGMPRLAGFPSWEDTAVRWEAITGRSAEHVGYYEVFAAFRFGVVMLRLGRLMKQFELIPPDSDFEINNAVTGLLAKLLPE